MTTKHIRIFVSNRSEYKMHQRNIKLNELYYRFYVMFCYNMNKANKNKAIHDTTNAVLPTFRKLTLCIILLAQTKNISENLVFTINTHIVELK
jgi:hypothetical protein